MSGTAHKLIVIPVMITLFLCSYCNKNYYSKKDLSESESDFISKVRYIITKKEKKRFYSLVTVEEKNRFIEEFWKQRDPDPGTEENEFKLMYFKRIEEANHLFRDGGRSGWLSDRGRVFILLGPPEMRRYYPGVVNARTNYKSWYNFPHEIWYYGFYPIYFYDRYENGNFQLLPVSAQNISTILNSTLRLKPEGSQKKVAYDYSINLKKMDNQGLNLILSIPYKNILFQQKEDSDKFTATLTVHLEAFDKKDQKVLDLTNDYPISMTEEELKTAENDHKITVPFTLKPGKYQLQVILESKADQIRNKKRIKFSI